MFIPLLFIIPEFLLTPTFYFSCFAAGFGLFSYFHKLHLDRLNKQTEEAKIERDKLTTKFEDLEKRILPVEKVQSIAYPKFQTLDTEFKTLTETVKNHHEMRLLGIVNEIGNMRDNIELRFKSTERDIAEIKKCFDKLEEKFDKLECKLDNNNKELLTEIMKLNKTR